MKVCEKFSDLLDYQQPIHWAVGMFDGVHLGHKRVILSADSPGALRGVLTFRTHPLAFLNPTHAPLLITPHPQLKYQLFEKLGVDVVLELVFTPELAALSPTQFLDTLCQHCKVAGISVGANWRFGKGGSGNAVFLQHEAQKRGFRAVVSNMLVNGNSTVCSSLIRSLLKEGKMKCAASMLGRPYSIYGPVEHGQHLARKLGFPTANITPSQHSALPKAGVYFVSAQMMSETYYGIANVGTRPSIDESTKIPRLEAHFPHWHHGDFYGQQLEIFLHDFIRPEIKFDSLQQLQYQIQQDLESIKKRIDTGLTLMV